MTDRKKNIKVCSNGGKNEKQNRFNGIFFTLLQFQFINHMLP